MYVIGAVIREPYWLTFIDNYWWLIALLFLGLFFFLYKNIENRFAETSLYMLLAPAISLTFSFTVFSNLSYTYSIPITVITIGTLFLVYKKSKNNYIRNFLEILLAFIIVMLVLVAYLWSISLDQNGELVATVILGTLFLGYRKFNYKYFKRLFCVLFIAFLIFYLFFFTDKYA